MAKVMADERVTQIAGGETADMSLMRYGGFETFVNP